MVSDQQAKRFWRLARRKWSLEIASAKAGMDPRQRENTCGIGAGSAMGERRKMHRADQFANRELFGYDPQRTVWINENLGDYSTLHVRDLIPRREWVLAPPFFAQLRCGQSAFVRIFPL
jgi:hypothetical protein